MRIGGEHHKACGSHGASTLRCVVLGDDGQMEQAARRGAYALAVVRVNGLPRRTRPHRHLRHPPVRITVPALPGSATSARTATSRGEVARTVAKGRLRNRANGDDALRSARLGKDGCNPVSDDIGGDTEFLGGRHDCRMADVGAFRADEQLGTTTEPVRRCSSSASATARGPSAENCLASSRSRRRCSRRAAMTGRGADGADDLDVVRQAAPRSAGSAPRATSTSVVNAAASRTARSASILRSTSTSAALRPWMNRL